MADRIEQQINNATAAIQKLNREVANLQARLQGGDLGTDQIAKLEQQLNRLTANLEKRTARRQALVGKQDTIEVERINKAISTLQAKIEGLRGKLVINPDVNIAEQINKDIANAERALKSFQSRVAGRQLQPSGAHTFTPDPTRSTGPIETPNAEDVERRLNKALLGMPLSNAEVQAKVKAARKIATDILYGRTSLERQEAGQKDKAWWEGGHQPGEAPFVPDAAAQAAFTRALGEDTNATDKATRAKKRLIEEEKRLADLRKRIATDPVFKQYVEQLRARGLDLGDIQSAVSRGGGITQVTAARNQGGINNKFQGYVNERTGSSTPGLSSQFRTFGGDILRDIGQFTKWSIAIAAVYTPLQKLGELMAIMVDNESRLADATIAANIPFEKSGQLFDTVAESANQAGEGINTTIDAYTQAIRAAGRYNSEQEKSQKGLALLNDSLILSKLSTLDQSTAIDTLSAALLQADKQLDEGQELLNKWVRISQIANVTVDGLATGVAVLGDSAETVGLSIDQLNGLIAVLSEQSISGAKEAANTAKALVGAYQSDKAEAALNKYGIALRKANGEVRGFLEIYQELAQLRESGVLSEAAVSEVALALGGGGVRRSKDASALINSTERLNKLAEESAKITGEDTLANDALAKKLETVQTANTRLANSFQELAQTLGDDGGLLDSFKILINLLTGTLKATNELFSLLGRSGPILATFVTGLAAMNAYYNVGGRKDVALAKLGAGQFGGFLGTGGGQFAGQQTNAFGGGILADIMRMNYRGAGVIGAAGVGLQAASNVQAGKLDNAGANVIGGAIGGAIGAYLGGPAGLAIGSNVGSAVGDAFLNAVFEHSGDLQDYLFPKDFRPERTEQDRPTQVQLDEKSLSDLLDLASKEAGIGGNLKAFFAATVGPGFGAYGGRKESALLDTIKGTNPELYNEIMQRNAQQQADEARRLAESRVTGAGGGAEFEQRRKINEELASKARQEQLTRLATGQITSAEFGRVSSQLAGFPAASIKSIENFGDELANVSDQLDSTTEAYDAFLYISTYGTQDQINNISQYSDDILKLTGYLRTLEENPALIGTEFELSWGKVKIESPEQLRELIENSQKAGATAFGVTLQQVQKSQGQAVQLPPLIGDYNKPLTGRGQDAVVSRGLKIQEQYLIETGKTTEEIAKFKQAIEEFYAAVDRGLGTAFEPVQGLTQQFYDLGKAAAEAAGELESLKGFGFQQFDVDRASLERAAQQSVALGQNWAKQFPGFETKPEDLLAITNEGMVKPIHADLRILALLLEQLNEKSQKQLDGQYNIPEGATFWVPLTAAYYRNKGGAGTGDLTQGLDLSANTSATDQNTQALREAAQAFRGDLGYSRAAVSDRQSALGYRGDLGFSRKATENQQTALGYRGDLGYGRTASTQQGSLIQQLITAIRNLFTQGNVPFSDRSGGPRPPSTGGFGAAGGRSVAQQQTSTPQVNTRLDLRLSSNINLVVDGRVLANTLQSYLASELLRTEQTTGVITKRYVI
jgi:TP901 family phage tail tape measure protein